MTFLRRTDQEILIGGWEEIAPPDDFVQRAYALGLEPGSGEVRLMGVSSRLGIIRASLTGRAHGQHFTVRVLGSDANDAANRLLLEFGKLRGRSSG